MPVGLLLRMFNSLEDGRLREEIIEYIKSSADQAPHEHVWRGFCRNEDGTLRFEKTLYPESLCHGKVATYSGAVRDKVERLTRELDMLLVMRESLVKSETQISPGQPQGQIAASHPSLSLEEEQAASAVRIMLEQIRKGLPE